MKNKMNILLIVLFIIAGCLVAGLWYMNIQETNVTAVDNANATTDEQNNDLLVFDESKIINKNADYSYTLSEANTVLLTKKDDGYYLNEVYDQDIDGKSGTTEFKVNGDYTEAILGAVDEGGPGIDSLFAVLLNSKGNVYYVNYYDYVNNKKTDIKTITTVNKAKKLYVASCTNKDQTEGFYDGRDTILVQKVDGSIIDLYDILSNYVY